MNWSNPFILVTGGETFVPRIPSEHADQLRERVRED